MLDIRTTLKKALHLVVPFVFLTSGTVFAQQTELEDIQQQIKTRQETIKRQLEELKKLEDQLKKAELEIAATARDLNSTQINLENNKQQQTQLKDEQKDLRKKTSQQQDVLAKQLRSAYMAGNHDYAKLLFNQQDAARLERVLSYYKYLNEARQQQITEFTNLAAQLDKVNRTLVEKQQELESLQIQQQQQQQLLSVQQNNRKQTQSKIEKAIDSEAAKIEQLQINEQALLTAIRDAEERARRESQEQQELAGLSNLKGRLLKPASGRIQKLYGKRRQGQVRWKGILIDSRAGSSVSAIHRGQVLYADWLRGFGLVMVVDHGDGYMSLYGHNQALLKQAGDPVDAGETIALVGQSGGQSSPNLYFEIRHKGSPINPTQWLAP